MTEAGTAVSRTERTEYGGRMAVNLLTALSRLLSAAGFVGRVEMPAMEASPTNSAVSMDCRFSSSGAAILIVARAAIANPLINIPRIIATALRESTTSIETHFKSKWE